MTCLGKADIMSKMRHEHKWLDEEGNEFDADVVEQEFDSYIKKALKHIVRDTVQMYIRQISHFPVEPDEVLQNIGAGQIVTNLEKREVRLDTASVFLENDKLADAIEQLNVHDKRFLELDFIYGLSDKEISEELNVSKAYVYLFRQRILQKLAFLMEVEDAGK